jgi:heme/copper-type cytochrome/quinol oxidase subunit 4
MSKGKVYDYVVVLKNNNKSIIERTGWQLSFLSILPISMMIYQNPTSIMQYILLFAVASLMISLYFDKKKNKKVQFLSLLLCIGVGLIALSGNMLLGILYIIAGISERFLSANVEIGFSVNEIVKKELTSKSYQWNELNNVVIKDDLLTMDFKNNTLFQAYTDDEEDDEYDVEDDEFNEYCKRQLSVDC